MRKFILFAAITTLFSSPAFAQDCEAVFVDDSVNISISNVNIGPREITQQSFAIMLQNDGNEPCEAQVRITRIEGTAIPAPLAYSIGSGPSVLEIQANAGAPANSQGNLLVPQIPNTSRPFAVDLLVRIPTDWGLDAGEYQEQLQLQLLDQFGQPIDTLLLNLLVRIPPSVEMRVVGAAGSGAVATINLGEIDSQTSSVSDPVGIRVWSTSPYVVRFQSDNNGRLLHENGTETIPYQLAMEGRPVDLTTPTEFAYPRKTPAAGEVYRLQFRAGPVNALAGDYNDRVTVTIAAV